jgi:catechol 2,3-dioxygenase-like lactoylglutathione lyase family enzyme
LRGLSAEAGINIALFGRTKMAFVDAFSHLVVQVTDLDRSEKFYQEVLGLDVVGRDLVREEGPNSLLKTNTGQMVLLIQVPDVEPFRPNSNSIHHAWLLTVEQYRRAQERMKAFGYSIEDSREEFRAMGERSMDIYDPDGHRYQVQAHGPEATQIIRPSSGKIDCGRIADFEIGSVTSFSKAMFFLVRLNEGFLALSSWCTHRNGQLKWEKEHWRFYCPFHSATYDRRGEFTGHLENVGPLRLHPVTITNDGNVIVDTSEVLVRKTHESSHIVPAACGAAFCGANVEHI